MQAYGYEDGVLLKQGAWQMMLSWDDAEKLKEKLFSLLYHYKRDLPKEE